MFNTHEQVIRINPKGYVYGRSGTVVELTEERARVRWDSEMYNGYRRPMHPVRTWVNFKFLRRLNSYSKEELHELFNYNREFH